MGCQVHSSHIHSSYKTSLNYNNSKYIISNPLSMDKTRQFFYPSKVNVQSTVYDIRTSPKIGDIGERKTILTITSKCLV